ncbi:MAG: Holliday junction branch migration DNA helicase RuvB [Bacteroides sp.]|nr:MAG: Holliday junction branch migration DNA helicase RuvB [Bacteroides sp.]
MIDDNKNDNKSLRPNKLDNFIGQDDIIKSLKIFVGAAKGYNESLDHVLLHGSAGLGKTTLAYILSNELKSKIVTTSGPIIDKPANLIGILINLKKNDILFIDEIHRLSKVVEEYLYTAMEDYKIDIIIDKGSNSKSIPISLNSFTLVGATTKFGMLSQSFRERFGIIFKLEYYDNNILTNIILKSSQMLNIDISRRNAMKIAVRSRGTPRIANNLLKRIRDFAYIENNGIINNEIINFSLKLLKIDKNGLNEIDHKILNAIINKFGGGPVGLKSLSSSIGEDYKTIEEYYEPFLIQEGYIVYTHRGRKITLKAIKQLQRKKILMNKILI